jgi:hypothetical protein
MIKNCNRNQRLLDRYLRNELSPTLRSSIEEHLGLCESCREALGFRRALDSRLDLAVEPPSGLRARFETMATAPIPRRSWLVQTLGDPTMRKILVSTTLTTAVVAGAILLAPSQAHGATAHEKLASMRSALVRALGDGELSITGILTKDNDASFSVTLDGSPLPPDVPVKVQGEKHEGYSDYTVKIDFSDANFSSVSFGKDQNTLKLIPKASPDTLDVVSLDPKTGKPLTWTEYKLGSDKPITTITYKSRPLQAPVRTGQKAPFDAVLTGDKAPSVPVRPAGNAPSDAVRTTEKAPFDGVVTAHIRFVTQ